MILSRIFAPVVLFLGSGILVSAKPTSHQSRSEADIVSILNTLKTSNDGVLPKLDALVDSGNFTAESLTPHFDAIKAALDAAAKSLSDLAVQPAPSTTATPASELARRQSADDIAKLAAGIIASLATTLGRIVNSGKTIPGLDILLGGIDTSLNQVLKGLGILLQGVLNLLANLLSNVADLLRKLALGLSLGTLGM